MDDWGKLHIADPRRVWLRMCGKDSRKNIWKLITQDSLYKFTDLIKLNILDFFFAFSVLWQTDVKKKKNLNSISTVFTLEFCFTLYSITNYGLAVYNFHMVFCWCPIVWPPDLQPAYRIVILSWVYHNSHRITFLQVNIVDHQLSGQVGWWGSGYLFNYTKSLFFFF